MQKIFFWWISPDPITIPFFSAVQDSGRFDVTVIFERKLPEFRRQSGWSGSTGRLNSTYFLDQDDWKSVANSLIADHPEAIHVFGGIGSYPKLTHGCRQALDRGNRCYAIAERPNLTSSFNNFLRRMRMWYRYQKIGRRLSGILAMGQVGRAYYEKIGCPADKIFDWMYFVESKAIEKPDLSVASTIHLVFVGRIVKLKRVDLLLHALATIEQDYTLEVLGSGDQLIQKYEILAEKLGIASKVVFLGGVPNEETVEKLFSCDLLVLPSRYDGWGAVINEAINAGCAVICSDECGAQDLVAYGKLGEIFKAGDVAALNASLVRMMKADRLFTCKENAFRYRKYIDPIAAVDYFETIVNENQETLPAPWVQRSETRK